MPAAARSAAGSLPNSARRRSPTGRGRGRREETGPARVFSPIRCELPKSWRGLQSGTGRRRPWQVPKENPNMLSKRPIWPELARAGPSPARQASSGGPREILGPGQEWRATLDAMLLAPRREALLLIVASFGGCNAARACGIGSNTLAAPLLARLVVEFPGALVAEMEEDRFLVAVATAEADLPGLPGIAETLSEPLDLDGRRIPLMVSLGCLLADVPAAGGGECLARCESARAAAARNPGPALVFYGDPAEGASAGSIAEDRAGNGACAGVGRNKHADRR